ncbi:MAG TPA: hypothetical protein VFP39_05515 [Gemmatimonadales bacterium]|nr:hypothetical protein [Gemmatimonadales bacterium]
MTLFDLLFIVLFLAGVAVLVSALVLALRGHAAAALRRLRTLALATLGYMALVAAVSLVMPRAAVAVGDNQCSDDWCIAVEGARHLTDGSAVVTFRLSSRARRVTQRERFVVVYLRDSGGRRYDADPAPDQPPFDVVLPPGGSVSTERVFRGLRNTGELGVIVTREGDVPFPRCCIIGTGIFHKDPIVPLP